MTLEEAAREEWQLRLEELAVELHSSCEYDDQLATTDHPHHTPDDIWWDLDDCSGGTRSKGANYVYGALMSLERILENANLARPSTVIACPTCLVEGTPIREVTPEPTPIRVVARTHR